MPKYIVKIPCDGEDYYLEWSSVVDAPITYGMTLDEFKAYYKKEYGEQGMSGLPVRLARVEETGTSDAIVRDPVEKWIKYNRAGEKETPLTFAEIVDKYIREPRKEGKTEQDG